MRVLQAEPQARLSTVVGPGVIGANPFMVGVSASGLVARAARDIYGGPKIARAARRLCQAGAAAAAGCTGARWSTAVALTVKCNQKLVSCQRWVALKRQQLTRDAQAAAKRKTAVPKLRGAGA